MTIQSDTGTYTGVDKALEIAGLRAAIAAEIPSEELASLGSDLIEFFTAFGECNGNPEGASDA